MGEAGADVVGVDLRMPLDEAARRVGPGTRVQGNLDPAVLFAPWEAVDARVARGAGAPAGRRGHVFNLGHGVIPDTDPDVLARVVELVHEESAARWPDSGRRIRTPVGPGGAAAEDQPGRYGDECRGEQERQQGTQHGQRRRA